MIGPTDLLHPSPAPHFKTFQVNETLKNKKKLHEQILNWMFKNGKHISKQ
jgi:hypothetical protein